MRFVNKDLTNIPPSLISSEALNDIEKIANQDASINIKDKLYKGEYKDSEGKSQSQVRDYLNIYYKEKCAYCETICKAEIEHYRPKKAVIEDRAHNGYYWLCYTWSNLVPSCRYCNTEGGKGNKFPIIEISKRVNNPDFIRGKLDKSKCESINNPLIEEKPFLLHPEIDNNIKDYLEFKISIDKIGVTIVGIDTLKRGEKTIEICNLNRKYLRIERLQNVYYDMKQSINSIFKMNANGLISNEKLPDCLIEVYKDFEKKSEDIHLTHTLLRKFVISNPTNFENHFAPYLDIESVRIIAIEIFKKYKMKERS